jgi:chitin synthase
LLKNKSTGEIILTFFKPPVGALVAAMISTFGIYLFASFLYVSQTFLYLTPLSTDWFTKRDPWHMFSSFFQYLCLAPSFTNVLNVYAFCNLHDVSWGTKGSDKAEALPSVSSSKGKGEEAAVVQDTERVQEDLDDTFKETVNRAVTKLNVKEVPEKPSPDDQNKTFRTRLVVFWMLSNAALAMAIENINGLASSDPTKDEQSLRKKQNDYFAFILYSTFGLSAVRFIGVSGFSISLHYSRSKSASYSACGTSLSATSSAASASLENGEMQSFRFLPRLYLHFVNYTMDVS